MTNADQARYWNAAHHWVTDLVGHDEMLEPLGRLAHDALAPRPAERILDIGCGTGATSLALAADVGPDGTVVGIDLSATLLDVARERAAQVENVSFIEADAQTHEFDEPFNGAFSRFGVMFFENPVAAFTNIGRALRSGGRLVFVCWGAPADNAWWTVPARVVAEQGVTLPPPADAGAPSPFALADRDRLHDVLTGSGFVDVALSERRTDILLGGHASSVDTAVGFLRRSRLGAAVVEAAPSSADAVFDIVADTLSAYLTDRGVEMTAAVWVAAARRP
jgi:SAM-dependent methyltransferase